LRIKKILKSLRLGKKVKKQQKYFKKKDSKEIYWTGKKMMKQKNLEECEVEEILDF